MKRPRGKRRALAPLEPVDARDGPAMKALPTDRHRQFVRAMYQVKPGFGAAVRAAKLAGFGSSTSSPQSMATIASRLTHDPRVQAAFAEQDQLYIRASAPRAIRALSSLIENPRSKDHVRGLALVLDRTMPLETRHHVEVHHVVDHDAEAVAQLRMLKTLEVSRAKLVEVFGAIGLSRYERMLEIADAKNSPRLIEGSAVEIRTAEAS